MMVYACYIQQYFSDKLFFQCEKTYIFYLPLTEMQNEPTYLAWLGEVPQRFLPTKGF